MNFGDWLKEQAAKKNMSLNKIGFETDIGGPQLSRYANNKITPSLENFFKIVDALGLKVVFVDKEQK